MDSNRNNRATKGSGEKTVIEAWLKALDLLEIGLSSSQSYAIILWAVGVFPITIMGLLFLWNEGLALRSVAKLEKEGGRGVCLMFP